MEQRFDLGGSEADEQQPITETSELEKTHEFTEEEVMALDEEAPGIYAAWLEHHNRTENS